MSLIFKVYAGEQGGRGCFLKIVGLCNIRNSVKLFIIRIMQCKYRVFLTSLYFFRTEWLEGVDHMIVRFEGYTC